MKIKILLLAFSFTTLIGCSSDYDDAKTYLKCGIAARHLEQFEGLDKIQQKSDRFNNLQLVPICIRTSKSHSIAACGITNR